jgi:hypothetical protein
MKRTPLTRRTPLKRTGRLNPVSDKRRAENLERRCALCGPLRAHGIVTGCNGWADDADEITRRSAGGSITDVANIRPVGRACHRWIGEHPAAAREWGLVESRWGGAA